MFFTCRQKQDDVLLITSIIEHHKKELLTSSRKHELMFGWEENLGLNLKTIAF